MTLAVIKCIAPSQSVCPHPHRLSRICVMCQGVINYFKNKGKHRNVMIYSIMHLISPTRIDGIIDGRSTAFLIYSDQAGGAGPG